MSRIETQWCQSPETAVKSDTRQLQPPSVRLHPHVKHISHVTFVKYFCCQNRFQFKNICATHEKSLSKKFIFCHHLFTLKSFKPHFFSGQCSYCFYGTFIEMFCHFLDLVHIQFCCMERAGLEQLDDKLMTKDSFLGELFLWKVLSCSMELNSLSKSSFGQRKWDARCSALRQNKSIFSYETNERWNVIAKRSRLLALKTRESLLIDPNHLWLMQTLTKWFLTCFPVQILKYS